MAIKKEAISAVTHRIDNALYFDTIYIGGGTPSLVPARLLSALMDELSSIFHMRSRSEMEITIECNPESVQKTWIHAMKEAGINRISLGVQDLTPEGLKLLGRIHSVNDALKAVDTIREAGIKNLSIDLIYSLPGQDKTWLEKTLKIASSLCPEHLSAYELTIEPDTRFASLVAKGALKLPKEETRLDLTKYVESFLESKGLFQYEISNFARIGHECNHNINYWTGGDYLGLGCGAVSFFNNTRYFNTSNLLQYLDCIEKKGMAIAQEETLNKEARFRETLIMWLRMTKGADIKALYRRFGIELFSYYGKTIDKLCNQGLLEVSKDADTLRLTKRGQYISNYVLSHLV